MAVLLRPGDLCEVALRSWVGVRWHVARVVKVGAKRVRVQALLGPMPWSGVRDVRVEHVREHLRHYKETI